MPLRYTKTKFAKLTSYASSKAKPTPTSDRDGLGDTVFSTTTPTQDLTHPANPTDPTATSSSTPKNPSNPPDHANTGPNNTNTTNQTNATRSRLGSSSTISGETALSVMITTTSITRELADLCQFPPVRAAAGMVLMILKTVQVGYGFLSFFYVCICVFIVLVFAFSLVGVVGDVLAFVDDFDLAWFG